MYCVGQQNVCCLLHPENAPINCQLPSATAKNLWRPSRHTESPNSTIHICTSTPAPGHSLVVSMTYTLKAGWADGLLHTFCVASSVLLCFLDLPPSSCCLPCWLLLHYIFSFSIFVWLVGCSGLSALPLTHVSASLTAEACCLLDCRSLCFTFAVGSAGAACSAPLFSCCLLESSAESN